MNKLNDALMEQEILFYNSLKGKEKRDYFIAALTSEIILALREKRKEEKMTQSQIAKAMGVKQAYISKLENMDKIPTIETIAKYLYALKTPFEDVKVIAFNIVQKEDIASSFYGSVFSHQFVGYYTDDSKQNNDSFNNYYPSQIKQTLRLQRQG